MHVNKQNGKRYIGITKTSLYRRWGKDGHGYYSCPNTPICRAIKKYGWDGFEHVVLFENLSQEEASKKEIELIKEYKTQDGRYGYNTQPGGQLGNAGLKFSDESKRKMRDAKKGKKLTEEHKRKISEAGKGREAAPKSADGIRRLREANLGKTIPEETRQKISKTLTGIKRSPETLQKRKEHRKDIVKVYCPELDTEFPSINDASRDTAVPRSNIQKCLQGKRHTAGKANGTDIKLHWVKVG